MLKIESLGADSLEPILSGLLSTETTPYSFTLASTLLKVYPVDETYQITYLIMSALEQIESIRIRSNLNPTIDIETIMLIVRNNIYEELKENRNAGFDAYARVVCQVELDVFNDEVVGLVADSLETAVEQILMNAKDLGYSVEQSFALLINFIDDYYSATLMELSAITNMLANSDLANVHTHFWGWKRFLNRYKIYSSRKAPLLLTMVADFLKAKENWALGGDTILDNIDKLIEMEEDHIDSLTPVLEIGLGGLGDIYRIYKGTITVVVGGKGSGKTTFMSNIAAKALNKGIKTTFYSPETKKGDLMFGNIIPAYIRDRYGFLVTEAQVLGIEEPYNSGGDFTAEEKKIIIQRAKQEIVDNADFMHVAEYYMYQTLESDLRAHYKMHEPEILIFDHSQEIRGESDANKKTSLVASVLKSLVKDTGVAVLLLSHPSSGFKDALPTVEKPIVQDKKIAAWSQDVETLADAIMGIVRNGDTEFKIFFTKLRKGSIPPMYQILQMNKPHCWFDYRIEDQYNQSDDVDSIDELISNKFNLVEDDDEDGEDDFD